MKPSILRCIVGLTALWAATAVHGQATQAAESADVGARITIPKDWEWRERATSPRSKDLYVDCAPKKNDRGRPACYFTISGSKAPPGQATITDADRAKWKGWAYAGGMRTILSTEDIKVGGLPAHHIVVRQGKRSDDTLGSDLYVLVPGKGKVLRISFNAILKPEDYELYKPAVMKALQTLTPAP